MQQGEARSIRVSVAMATYNGEKFVATQLSSILSQVPPPAEVLVADEGSDDGTVELVEMAARASPIPIRVVATDRVGLRLNVERAIVACKGEVIAWSDQDDLWMPGRIAAIESAFADPHVALWMSDATIINAAGREIGARLWEQHSIDDDTQRRLSGGRAIARLMHGATVTGATMAFRASVLQMALPFPQELDPPDHLFLHDGWIAALAAIHGRMALDPRPLTCYRRHSEQFTARQSSEVRRFTAANLRSTALREHTRRAKLLMNRVWEHPEVVDGELEEVQMLTDLHGLLSLRVSTPSMRRSILIVKAWKSGLYRRCGRTWRTALADLAYPAR